MSELKTTALYSLHIELAAKMVNFSGYRMPLHYAEGIIKEHLHCRTQRGLFDVSHMGQISITGASVAKELETLTPGNITGLQSGQQRYIVLTNEAGGIIDDVIISHIDSRFLLVVNAACKEKVFQHLNNHLSTRCQIELLQDQALIALQGPLASKLITQLSKPTSKLRFMQSCSTQIDKVPCVISRCGYTGEDGFEISIANNNAESLVRKILKFSGIKLMGLGARDTLRIEAGLSLYGHELNESINPVDAGLSWTFRKNATHYLGVDNIHPLQNKRVHKRIVGLVFNEKPIVRSNTPLYDKHHHSIGVVTSGSFSPSLKKSIALALIDSTYSQKQLIVKVRGHTITADITPLPFVAHRYYR